MMMLGKHSRVMDCITETFDQVRNFSLIFITANDAIGNAIIAEVFVLDWTRVAVMINHSPGSFSSFEFLIWNII